MISRSGVQVGYEKVPPVEKCDDNIETKTFAVLELEEHRRMYCRPQGPLFVITDGRL